MSISLFSYTKDWTNPQDFPTVETSEAQVRADIQLLYDEAKDKINEIITATNALESTSVYPAEKGTTTIPQLVTAYVSGSAIICEYNGLTYYLTYYNQSGSTYTFGFTSIEGKVIKRIAVTGDSSSTNWGNAPDIDFDAYATLASPTLTGTPKAPTATAGTNTTQIATTAFVQSAVAVKAPLASPALTGTPTAPTATAGTNTTQIATTAFVQSAVSGAGSSPSSTTPKMDGTAAAGSETAYARGDHIHPTDTSRAPLASPTFTGTPKAPTATAGTNTTQIATTAFVQSAVTAATSGVSGVKGDAEVNYRTGNVNLTPANLGAQPTITASGILKGNGSGTISAAAAGTDYAAASHNHSASEITSGELSVARGGTGASSFTSGEFLVGNGTGAITTKGIRNNTSTNDTIPENTAIPTTNTLRYAINRTTSVAAADTNYTTYMARGEALNSTDTNPTVNGTISWTYA